MRPDYLFTEQWSHANLIILDQIQIHPNLRIHERLPTLRLAPIQPAQKLPQLRLIVNNLLDLLVLAAKLKLVSELRVPLAHTPDDSATPVVAADDDSRDAELLADAGDGVGVILEAEVVEVVGCTLPFFMRMVFMLLSFGETHSIAVAFRIESNTPQSQLCEHGDLISPCQ